MNTSGNPERGNNIGDSESFTNEDFQVLEAIGRIQTIDGTDYLDGVALPPDNDEPYSDETFSMDVTELYGPDDDGKWSYRQYTRTFTDPSTNNIQREQSIRSLATGIGIVYPLNGSSYFIGLEKFPSVESRLQRAKRRITTLLFGKKPEQESI